MYVTADGGKTWEQRTDLQHEIGGYPDLLVHHPRRPELMFVASAEKGPGRWYRDHYAGSRISRSADGGRTWQIGAPGVPRPAAAHGLRGDVPGGLGRRRSRSSGPRPPGRCGAATTAASTGARCSAAWRPSPRARTTGPSWRPDPLATTTAIVGSGAYTYEVHDDWAQAPGRLGDAGGRGDGRLAGPRLLLQPHARPPGRRLRPRRQLPLVVGRGPVRLSAHHPRRRATTTCGSSTATTGR